MTVPRTRVRLLAGRSVEAALCPQRCGPENKAGQGQESSPDEDLIQGPWSGASVSGATRLPIDANRHEDLSRGGGTYEALEGLEDGADNGRHDRPFRLNGPRD